MSVKKKVPQKKPRFWEVKTLSEMTDHEWEALCDRCGRCCLHKLEDIDTGENHYTRVSCKLYDLHNLCCSNYPERLKQVPECLHLRPVDLNIYRWLPKTCAYRRLSEGKNLLTWHPLISGQQDSVVEAGISIRNIAISETDIPPNPDWEEYVWEERVIRWVEIKEED